MMKEAQQRKNGSHRIKCLLTKVARAQRKTLDPWYEGQTTNPTFFSVVPATLSISTKYHKYVFKPVLISKMILPVLLRKDPQHKNINC